MRTDLIELKNFLKIELAGRTRLKPNYSQRAFSRDLGISPTVLNEFLQGKRELSFMNIDRIFRYLNKKRHCSWCDKPQKNAKYLIGGPRSQFICDACVDKCVDIAKNKTPFKEN
jgi:transcriptional regulator with XRE-family HTH domain